MGMGAVEPSGASLPGPGAGATRRHDRRLGGAVAYETLPGGDVIEQGLADLARGIESVPGLLVSIGAPRLRRLGVGVPAPIADPELRLYQLLASSDPDSAHGRYNALVRRLVSFERSAACAS